MSDIKNNIETVNEVFTKFLEKRGLEKLLKDMRF